MVAAVLLTRGVVKDMNAGTAAGAPGSVTFTGIHPGGFADGGGSAPFPVVVMVVVVPDAFAVNTMGVSV